MNVIQDLMNKAPDTFLDHFARLGIFSKVQQLAAEDEQPPINAPTEANAPVAEAANVITTTEEVTTATSTETVAVPADTTGQP